MQLLQLLIWWSSHHSAALHNIYCVYLKPSWANTHSYKDTRTEHENNKHISEPEETG